ncbi:MAG: hypothetical protein Q8R36_00215 [bacterium]|nr:hypothetical protein [bacterium]
MSTNRNKVGLVFAALFGGVHVLWSILVFLGWAQPLVNFILWAHMIQVLYVVGPFDALASATLIVVTAFVGYVVGSVVSVIWNKVHQGM